MTPITEQTLTLDIAKNEWFTSQGKQDRAQALSDRICALAKALKIAKPRKPIILVITVGGARKYHPSPESYGPATKAIIAGLGAYGIDTNLIIDCVYYPGKAILGYIDGTRCIEIALVNQEGLW